MKRSRKSGTNTGHCAAIGRAVGGISMRSRWHHDLWLDYVPQWNRRVSLTWLSPHCFSSIAWLSRFYCPSVNAHVGSRSEGGWTSVTIWTRETDRHTHTHTHTHRQRERERQTERERERGGGGGGGGYKNDSLQCTNCYVQQQEEPTPAKQQTTKKTRRKQNKKEKSVVDEKASLTLRLLNNMLLFLCVCVRVFVFFLFSFFTFYRLMINHILNCQHLLLFEVNVQPSFLQRSQEQ